MISARRFFESFTLVTRMVSFRTRSGGRALLALARCLQDRLAGRTARLGVDDDRPADVEMRNALDTLLPSRALQNAHALCPSSELRKALTASRSRPIWPAISVNTSLDPMSRPATKYPLKP